MTSPLGPLELTATSESEGTQAWTTEPDSTMGTGSVFTAAGQYKVKVTVFDTATMASAIDENLWTIP